MSGQMWTPAPRRGIVPLHPFTFGTVLGRSFAVLRHNPKVVLTFAVLTQLAFTIVTAGIMVVILVTTIGRLDRVSYGSPDFEPLLIGTIAINGVAGFVIGLLSVAFTALLQGVVAAEASFAVLGEKVPLARLWGRMRPVFWRLFGFAMLQILYMIALVLVIVLILTPLAMATGASADFVGIGIGVTVLIVLAAVPLSVWLSTKLLLTPSVLVFEHATLRGALVRSWRLTRGRFWFAFGVTIVIGLIMGLAAQVIATPASLISGILIPILAPTGSTVDPTAIILAVVLGGLLPQILLLVVQAIAVVVQSTSAALVYLDCRFRYEGLDQTLLAHLERRELGWSAEQLGDPYAVDPARAVSRTPPPQPVYAQPAFPQPAFPQPGYPQPQPQGYPPAPSAIVPPPPYVAPSAPPVPSAPVPPDDSPWAPPRA